MTQSGVIKEVKMGKFDSYLVKIEGSDELYYAGKWDNDFWSQKKVGHSVEYELKDGKYINLPKKGGGKFVGKNTSATKTNAQCALECASVFSQNRPNAKSKDVLAIADYFKKWLDENKD